MGAGNVPVMVTGAMIASTGSLGHTSRILPRLNALIVLSFVLLLPSKILFNIPILVMALLGIAALWCGRDDVQYRTWVNRIMVAFALVWVPLLVSALDAADASRALKAVVLYPRFAFVSVFIVFALRNEVTRRWCTVGVFFICAFWTLDAIFQYLAGTNVLGYPHENGQLRGIFYPKYRLGMSLVVFLPLLLDLIFRQRVVHIAWAFLIPLLLTVVALTLHRNAWLMSVLGLSLYGMFLLLVVGWRVRSKSAFLVALGLVFAIAFASTQPTFTNRLVPTISAMFGSSDAFEEQLGQRPDIWRTAINMFRQNMLTGVGPRSFRAAYSGYANSSDYWLALEPIQVPAHPHQIGLEVAAETGLFGIAGFVGLHCLVFYWWHRSGTGGICAAPWLIGAAIIASPINISKAFYGSVTASLVWWLLAMGLAVMWGTDARARGADEH